MSSPRIHDTTKLLHLPVFLAAFYLGEQRPTYSLCDGSSSLIARQSLEFLWPARWHPHPHTWYPFISEPLSPFIRPLTSLTQTHCRVFAQKSNDKTIVWRLSKHTNDENRKEPEKNRARRGDLWGRLFIYWHTNRPSNCKKTADAISFSIHDALFFNLAKFNSIAAHQSEYFVRITENMFVINMGRKHCHINHILKATNQLD